MTKTHKQKLAEVSERIRELVPRLMELSFGCLVEIKSPLGTNQEAIYLMDNGNDLGRFVIKYRTGIIYVDEFKKIGHPIRLEDMLEAIGIIGDGFGTQKWNDIDNIVYSGWQYGKFLSQQTPETIDFLHSLFFNQDKWNS